MGRFGASKSRCYDTAFTLIEHTTKGVEAHELPRNQSGMRNQIKAQNLQKKLVVDKVAKGVSI